MNSSSLQFTSQPMTMTPNQAGKEVKKKTEDLNKIANNVNLSDNTSNSAP